MLIVGKIELHRINTENTKKIMQSGGSVMTKEQLSKEVEYKMAVKLLNILLNRGIITDEEYGKIDELNRHTFSPELAKVYVS